MKNWWMAYALRRRSLLCFMWGEPHDHKKRKKQYLDVRQLCTCVCFQERESQWDWNPDVPDLNSEPKLQNQYIWRCPKRVVLDLLYILIPPPHTYYNVYIYIYIVFLLRIYLHLVFDPDNISIPNHDQPPLINHHSGRALPRIRKCISAGTAPRKQAARRSHKLSRSARSVHLITKLLVT